MRLTKFFRAFCCACKPRSTVRPRVSDLRETLQELIWKLFAYSNVKPGNVDALVETIEDIRFRFSIEKARGRTRYNTAELLDVFITDLFPSWDYKALNEKFVLTGYPNTVLTELEATQLRLLSVKFVHCVMLNTEFKVTQKDLLQPKSASSDYTI